MIYFHFNFYIYTFFCWKIIYLFKFNIWFRRKKIKKSKCVFIDIKFQNWMWKMHLISPILDYDENWAAISESIWKIFFPLFLSLACSGIEVKIIEISINRSTHTKRWRWFLRKSWRCFWFICSYFPAFSTNPIPSLILTALLLLKEDEWVKEFARCKLWFAF